jgi:hypothetical protein
MAQAAARWCVFHEERPAFAVCMSCAKTLCQECATQWDGIWHCAACLAAKRGTIRRQSHAAGWIAVTAVSLLSLFLSAKVMVWSGALLAGLR